MGKIKVKRLILKHVLRCQLLTARILLLSFSLNTGLDFKLLQASVPSVSALAQRDLMLKKISDPLDNVILNSKNPFMQAPGPVPAWNLVWSSLKTKVATGNLQPSDLVNPVNSDLSTLTTANKFTSIYNNFYSQLGPELRTTALGADANQTMLLSLIYFGADAPHDGSVFTADDGVTLSNWYPAAQDPDGNPRPVASFYVPDSLWFNNNSANNNFETPGGLLIKTQVTNNNFCTALEQTYGSGVWSGATCINNSDCCQDSAGVQQICLKNSATAQLVPQLTDPVTGETIVYGICDTLDPAACGTSLGATCNGAGSGPEITPGCCTGDKLVCVKQTGDNLNNFKCLADTGGFCNVDSNCALADSKCVDNLCVAPKAAVSPTLTPGISDTTLGVLVPLAAIFSSAALYYTVARLGAKFFLILDNQARDITGIVRTTGITGDITAAAEKAMGERAADQARGCIAALGVATGGDVQVAVDHGIVGSRQAVTPATITAVAAIARGAFEIRPAFSPTDAAGLNSLIKTEITKIAQYAGRAYSKDLATFIENNSPTSNPDHSPTMADHIVKLLLLEEAKWSAYTDKTKPVDYNTVMRSVITDLNEKLGVGGTIGLRPTDEKYTQASFLETMSQALSHQSSLPTTDGLTADFLKNEVGASTYQMCKDIAQTRTQQTGISVTPEQVYSVLRERLADSPLKDRFPDWHTAPATRAPDFPYDIFRPV